MSSAQIHTQQGLLVEGCGTEWCEAQGLLYLLVGGGLLPQGAVIQAQLVEPEGAARTQVRLTVCIDSPAPGHLGKSWSPGDRSHPGLNHPAALSAPPPPVLTLGGRQGQMSPEQPGRGRGQASRPGYLIYLLLPQARARPGTVRIMEESVPHTTRWASCPGGTDTCWGQLWDSLVPSPRRPKMRKQDGAGLSFRVGNARMRSHGEEGNSASDGCALRRKRPASAPLWSKPYPLLKTLSRCRLCLLQGSPVPLLGSSHLWTLGGALMLSVLCHREMSPSPH